MNLLNLDWEIILIILKQYNDYKYCIQLLVTCKQLYNNELLMKEIKDHFTECRVNEDGDQHWYFNGKHHREDDKPAIILSNGTKVWYFNGKRHRESDKPAVIFISGSQHWYFNGKYHRDNDKPAIIDRDGYKEWLFNGKTHRENGPAIIHPDGYKYWYLNDIPYTEVEYWEEIKKINEKID